jgi:CubicO group peptidase (beta-lactamase class C family)
VGRAPRDRVRVEARRLLAAGVAGQVFPGASACVSFRDGGRDELVLACAGTLAKGEPRVQESTRYDLGGVTRAFVATAAFRLAARGALDLDVGVESVLPDVRSGVLGAASIRSLLADRGGLAPWGGLYLDVPHEPGTTAARRWIVSEAARRPNEDPRTPIDHSDLGYMVAGEAIARVAGEGLEAVVAHEVLEPLGIAEHIGFLGALPTERRATIARHTAPTERCEWRGRLMRAEVQDENAYALGGVAGHAGLFGTAEGVGIFGRAVLDALAGRGSFLPRASMEAALAPIDASHVRTGWDARHGRTPQCGRRMGARSFGVIGITGCSLFCDPELDVAVALLTNRICPSRANEKIDGFRPAFHDGVLAAIKS